ncbi:hypothetical protein DFQ30_005069 [Apophysomyces sp. BC1015]|nr:hypothetical protein DFQ30_005069 [Apophysomyces sp. BC1015]
MDDSLYEYDKRPYCRYHYSLLRGTDCAGCRQAILQQFVEQNEHNQKWHPECYIIQKYWNICLADDGDNNANMMDPATLYEKQMTMDRKRNQIWTDMSAFEESSATCISDILVHVAAGAYQDSLFMANQFMKHIQALSAAFDTISMTYDPEPSYGKPFRTLCEQAVQFFDILAHTGIKEEYHEKKGLRAEMLPAVTGLAQSLKELIHIGLVEALRLEQLAGQEENAVARFLGELRQLERSREWTSGRYWFKDRKEFQSADQTWDDDVAVVDSRNADRKRDSAALKGEIQAIQFALRRLTEAFNVAGKRPDEVKQSKMHDVETKININVIDKQLPPSILQMMETDDRLIAGPTFGKVQLGKVKRTTLMVTRSSRPSPPPPPPTNPTHPPVRRTAMASPSDPSTIAPLSRTTSTTMGPSKMNSLRRALSGRRRKAASLPKIIDESNNNESSHSDSSVSNLSNPTTQSLPTLTSSRQTFPTLLMDLFEFQDIVVRHLAVLHLEVYQKDLSLEEMASLVDSKKAVTLWTKLKIHIRGGNFKHQQQLQQLQEEDDDYHGTRTFGVPLVALTRREGLLPGHPPTGPTKKPFPPIFLENMSSAMKACFMESAQIPAFVQHCILAMWQVDILTEGIFRKNGNIRDLKRICETIDQDPTRSDVMYLDNLNSIQLAALLKRFFRQMPEPLLTFKLHKLFIAAMDLDTKAETKQALHLVYCLLPKPNRDVTQLLFTFLNKVASFQESNKMDIHNLARVFAPNVLYPEKDAGQPLHTQNEISAVSLLIQYQEEFSMVPIELIKTLEETNIAESLSQMDSKQFLRTYSGLLKKQSTTKTQNRRSWILHTQ